MNPLTENPETFGDDPVQDLMRDALAMVEKCIECGSCYIDCAFKNYGDLRARCKEWVRESNDFLLGKIKKISPKLVDANLKCAECNRCFQSCPEKIYRRHGNMMMKHLTGNPIRQRLNIHPYSNWRVKQPAIEKFVLSKWSKEEKNWYHNRLNTMKPAEVLLYHGCYVYLQPGQCMKLEEMLTAAGVSFTTVGKLEYCCGTFGFYRGHDDMSSIKPRLLEMANSVKPQRIITNCGHCYNAMQDLVGQLGDGIRPQVRHAAEELLDHSIEQRIDFAHLGRTCTIHDSCNFRQLHGEHGPLRSFLRRIGFIHEMLSHGADGKCCGDVSRYYAPEHVDLDNRKVKVREFVSSGAENMVTVCAGCFEHFHANPILKTIDLIDLAYESFAVARAEDLQKEADRRAKWLNMAPVMEEGDDDVSDSVA